MKTSLICIQFTVLIVISSCITYKEYDEESFSNYSWSSGQQLTFKPLIEDAPSSYELGLGIRHVYGLRNSHINITIKSISPSGIIKTENHDFFLKDGNGNYLSSCAGDMCDLETYVNNDLLLEEAGEYTFFLSHNMPSNISGILAFGLLLNENN